LAAFSASWTFTQSVGILGWGISLLQGCCLHAGQHKHKMHRDIHVLSGIRIRDPSVWANEDSSCSYLLTELSPSWGAINWAAAQDLPSFSWNPKVQYRVHKSAPLVPILSHIYPIHTIPSNLSKINFDIVHSYTSWSSQWSLSLWVCSCPG
jgi:hypothetical protein